MKEGRREGGRKGRKKGEKERERESCEPPELLCYCSNWGRLKIQKGQMIESRHAESWGQVYWVLGWRHTTALLLLFSYSLKPYF
jgi:hypothetical protein